MTEVLIATGGIFVGFMLRTVWPARPPVDHFDVFSDIGEPPSNVAVRDVA